MNPRIVVNLFVLISVIACPAAGHEEPRSAIAPISEAIYKELNGIERSVHREMRQTVGTKPATLPLDQLKAKYDLSPRNHNCPVYFGQPNVRSSFAELGSFYAAALEDVAARLKTGIFTPEELPIHFLWVDGKRVTLNNRSLAALYMAGMRPAKLIDLSDNPNAQSNDFLTSVLRRLEGMGGKPSTEILVRSDGIGRDGEPKQASDWDAPTGAIVSMPDDVLMQALTCEQREINQD